MPEKKSFKMKNESRFLDDKEARQAIRLIAKIKKSAEKIANERDKLREYVSDVEAILESTTEGLDDFTRGLDRISQYV